LYDACRLINNNQTSTHHCLQGGVMGRVMPSIWLVMWRCL